MPTDETNQLEDNLTGFVVKSRDDGVELFWSDNPLDFIWQTKAQTRDLICKLEKLL